MFGFLDRLAGWWLDTRTGHAVRTNPDLGEFAVKRAQADERGFEVLATHPAVAILADEMAGFLDKFKASNFVVFRMMPRIDRGGRAVDITVRWAQGIAPGEKIGLLQDALIDMVAQHCALDDGRLSTFALSANDAALGVLERLGLVEHDGDSLYRFVVKSEDSTPGTVGQVSPQ